jgi:hypothetical protein
MEKESSTKNNSKDEINQLTKAVKQLSVNEVDADKEDGYMVAFVFRLSQLGPFENMTDVWDGFHHVTVALAQHQDLPLEAVKNLIRKHFEAVRPFETKLGGFRRIGETKFYVVDAKFPEPVTTVVQEFRKEISALLGTKVDVSSPFHITLYKYKKEEKPEVVTTTADSCSLTISNIVLCSTKCSKYSLWQDTHTRTTQYLLQLGSDSEKFQEFSNLPLCTNEGCELCAVKNTKYKKSNNKTNNSPSGNNRRGGSSHARGGSSSTPNRKPKTTNVDIYREPKEQIIEKDEDGFILKSSIKKKTGMTTSSDSVEKVETKAEEVVPSPKTENSEEFSVKKSNQRKKNNANKTSVEEENRNRNYFGAGVLLDEEIDQ